MDLRVASGSPSSAGAPGMASSFSCTQLPAAIAASAVPIVTP